MFKIIILLIFLSMSSFSNIENYGSKDRSKKLMVKLNASFHDDLSRIISNNNEGFSIAQTFSPENSVLTNFGFEMFFPVGEKFGISFGYSRGISAITYNSNISIEVFDSSYKFHTTNDISFSAWYFSLHYDLTRLFQIYGAIGFIPHIYNLTEDVEMGQTQNRFSFGMNYFYQSEIIFFVQYDSFSFFSVYTKVNDYSFSDFSTSIIYAGLKYQLPFNF